MRISEFQGNIRATYFDKDSGRGLFESFGWLVEEVGELATALRHGDPSALAHEFADCLAWLASVANIAGVDLEKAVDRYAHGCPRCGEQPCVCADNTH